MTLGQRCSALLVTAASLAFFRLHAARALSGSSAVTPPQLELSDVQSTSLLTAFWRDLESKWTDRIPLIHDRPAGTLVSTLLKPELAAEWRQSPLLDAGIDVLAVRTRAIDDWLKKGWDCEKEIGGVSQQVVNLGAGMCSRPYRLNPHSTAVQWFEVDDPSLLAAKRSVLENSGVIPNVDVVEVPGDVLDVTKLGESLSTAGLDPAIPTDWVLEGLLEYLDPSNHEPIFKMARERGGVSGSKIVMQVLEPATVQYFESIGISLPYENLVSANNIVNKLSHCGWSNARVRKENDFIKAYGRSPMLPGFCLVDAVAS